MLKEQLIIDIGDIGDIKVLRKITIKELVNLGYKLTGKYLSVFETSNSSEAFTIQEVMDADSKKAASFCYLFSSNKKTGAILKYEYDYYLNME